MQRSPRSDRATASRPSGASFPPRGKIEFIDRLIDAGVPRIEVTSFVSPRAVPQLADAEEVMHGVDRTRGAVLAALVPNKRGALRAAEAEVDEMVVFLSASESHNRKNVNREIEESLAGFEEVAKVAEEAGDARARRDLDRIRLPLRG